MVLRVHLTTHAEIVCVRFECVDRMWVTFQRWQKIKMKISEMARSCFPSATAERVTNQTGTPTSFCLDSLSNGFSSACPQLPGGPGRAAGVPGGQQGARGWAGSTAGPSGASYEGPAVWEPETQEWGWVSQGNCRGLIEQRGNQLNLCLCVGVISGCHVIDEAVKSNRIYRHHFWLIQCFGLYVFYDLISPVKT